ncbi:SWIM zinc finger family protein [Alicyclobacillus fructus]|uniref:SWIM zinc finger family protein n=1 Tax=Alicyclobacillus fructus TaxID=2816082 RepID=UPI001A90358E|nr:SWIM zinc finger family protein [Alicyclobacillus fructus]
MPAAAAWRKALRELTSSSGWEDLLPEFVFHRGVEYAEEGRVASWSLQGSVIHAVVRGEAAYQVDLHLEDLAKSRCSCPYGAPCKHMVAAALHAAREVRLSGLWREAPFDLEVELASGVEHDLPAHVQRAVSWRSDVATLIRTLAFVHDAPVRWTESITLADLDREARLVLLAADRIAQGETAVRVEGDMPLPATVTYSPAGWDSARRVVELFADVLADASPPCLAPYAVYGFRSLVADWGVDVPDDYELEHRALLFSLHPQLARAVKRLAGTGETAIEHWRTWSLARLSEAACAEDALVALASLQGGFVDSPHLVAAANTVAAFDDFPRPAHLEGCVPHVPWVPFTMASWIQDNWRHMMASALALGDLAAADALARLSPEVAPEAEEALAEAAISAQAWDVAESSLERLTSHWPTAERWDRLAHAFRRQGKVERAASCLREAFLCDPNDDRRDRWLTLVPEAARATELIRCAGQLMKARRLPPACRLLLDHGLISEAWRILELGLEGAEMWEPSPGMDAVIARFAQEDARRVTEHILHVALAAIRLRSRGPYRRAVKWLVALHAGLVASGRAAVWEEARTALAAESRRLPALRDELRASGLVP